MSRLRSWGARLFTAAASLGAFVAVRRELGDVRDLAEGALGVLRAHRLELDHGARRDEALRLRVVALEALHPIRLTRRDGARVKIALGQRLTWANPCGLSGVTIAATLAAIGWGDAGEPPMVCLEVDPCAELRALCAEVAKELEVPARERLRHDGLSGNGGKIVVAGEAFHRALYEGAVLVIDAKEEAGDG